MLDLSNHSCVSHRHLSIMVFIINQSSYIASRFSISPSCVLFLLFFQSSTLLVIPYIHLSPLIWELKRAWRWHCDRRIKLLFFSITHTHWGLQYYFRGHLHSICGYQSASFPSVMLTDCIKSAPQKKRAAEKLSNSILILTDDLYWEDTVSEVHMCKHSWFGKPLFLMHGKSVVSLRQWCSVILLKVRCWFNFSDFGVCRFCFCWDAFPIFGPACFF